MKTVLPLVTLLLLLTAVACDRRVPAPTVVNVPPAQISSNLTGDLASGAQLWRDKQCVACHGANGAGGMGGALANTSDPFAQFLSRTRNAQLPMPAITTADLSDGDTYSIYLWLHTQTPAQTSAATPAALPTGQLLGIQIWSEKGCTACHGAFAQGSDKAPRLAGESYPFERQRAVMRASADQNSKHGADNIPDDLLQRLLDWLRRGADPTSGC
ncbi:MAG: c-type cytochrome [Anaerolineae bacterium]